MVILQNLIFFEGITSCKFSESTPNLLAIGTIDGVVAIYDIRKNYNKVNYQI